MAGRLGCMCLFLFLQLSFAAAMKHKQIVMEVSVSAHAEGRFPLLGVLYDEIARSCYVSACPFLCLGCVCFAARAEWEDRAGKLGAAFSVDEAASKLSEEALRRARTLHATLFASTEPKPAGRSVVFHTLLPWGVLWLVPACFVPRLWAGRQTSARKGSRPKQSRRRSNRGVLKAKAPGKGELVFSVARQAT